MALAVKVKKSSMQLDYERPQKSKNNVGPLGPVCCKEQSHRIRFFEADAFDGKHIRQGAKPLHVGYRCNQCGRVRVAENEDDAATYFARG